MGEARDRHPLLLSWAQVHAMVLSAGRQLEADRAVLDSLLQAAQVAAVNGATRTLQALKVDSRLHVVVARSFPGRLKDMTGEFEEALANERCGLDEATLRQLAVERSVTARQVARLLDLAAANRRQHSRIEALDAVPL